MMGIEDLINGMYDEDEKRRPRSIEEIIDEQYGAAGIGADATAAQNNGLSPTRSAGSLQDLLGPPTSPAREAMAQTMFGDQDIAPLEPAAVHPAEVGAGIRQTGGIRDDTDLSWFKEKVGRIGGQLVTGAAEQVTMAAAGAAVAGRIISAPTGQRWQAGAEASKAARKFDPALEEINRPMGDPKGPVEWVARNIGPDLLAGGAVAATRLLGRKAGEYGAQAGLRSSLQGDYGLLSAANPGGVRAADDLNEAAMREGEEWLRAKGVDPRRATGRYFDEESQQLLEEPSFLAPGLKEEDAIEFGRKFGQNSVITPRGMVNLSDDTVHPRRGDPVFDNNAERNYTEVDGQKFSLDFDFDQRAPRIAAGPEKVTAAVVKVGGQIFRGFNHGEALDRAVEAGAVKRGDAYDYLEQGVNDNLFETNRGNLVDRFEASEKFGKASAEDLIPQPPRGLLPDLANERGAIGDQPPTGSVRTAATRVWVRGEAKPREYTGSAHPFARIKAEDELGPLVDEDGNDLFKVEDGFLDANGGWLSRKEGMGLAKRGGQLNTANIKAMARMKQSGNLYSEGLKRPAVTNITEHVDELPDDIDERIEQIRARFAQKEGRARASLRGRRGQRGALLVDGVMDPKDLGDLAVLGTSRLFRGVTGEDDFAREITEVAGEWVRPHLGEVRAASQKIYDKMSRIAAKTGDKKSAVKWDMDDLDLMFAEGKEGMHFYEKQFDEFVGMFGPDDGPLVLKLIAATSPRTAVSANSTLALKAYRQIKLGQGVQEGFVGGHRSILQRLIDTGEISSSGLKVPTFGKNLAFPDPTKDQGATIDMWMGQAFLGKNNVEPDEYVFIQEIVRDQAKRWGVAPRQYQAAIWRAIKKRNQGVERAGEVVTYTELVKDRIAKGYLDDLLETVDQPYLRKTRDDLQKSGRLGKNKGNAAIDIMGGIVGAGVGGTGGASQGEGGTEQGVLAGVGALAGGALAVVGGRAAIRGAAAGRRGQVRNIQETAALARKRLNTTPATGQADDYANVSKFSLDPMGEAALREEIEKIGPAMIGNPKEVVTWDQTRAMAKQIGLGDILEKDVKTRLGGAEMLAIRNVVNRNINLIVENAQKLQKAGGANPDADQMLAALESQNEALLSRFLTERARSGRDLNNLKILANRVDDPAFWSMKAHNMLRQGGEDISRAQLADINKLVGDKDAEGLVRYLMDLRVAPTGEKVATAWKASLLTGFGTHIANIAGNTAMGAMEIAKDLPATAFDRVLSKFTGQQTKSANVLRSTAAASKGAMTGLREARRVLGGAPTPEALARWDVPFQTNYNNPIIHAAVNGVFRLLGAQDRFFRAMALTRSLDEQARGISKGDKALLASLRKTPTDEMAVEAFIAAEYATFTRQSTATKAIGQLRDAGGTAGHFIAPFTRTPTNVAGTVVDYSPIGFGGAAKATWRLYKMATKGGSDREIRHLQRIASEKFGRAATGMIPIVVGYKLAEKGLATGARPVERSQGSQNDLQGKQENSILINGLWQNVIRLSPAGNLIALGANWHEIENNPELTDIQRLGGGAASIGTTLLESPFLQGADELLTMTKDPARGMGDFAGGLVGSAVPSLVRSANRGIDSTLRVTEATGDYGTGLRGIAGRSAATGINQLRAGIPGLSDDLPASKDQLGRDRQRTGGVFRQMFSPSRATKDERNNDPVIAEVARVGAVVPQLKREPGEPVQDYLDRQERVGRMLYQAFSRLALDTDYKKLSPLAQKDELEKEARKIRTKATKERRGQ